jgi:hypothetical protein
MAEVTNYGTLKDWVSNTGHRGDLGADIPGFIQDAEVMIADSVRAIELVTTTPLVEADRDAGAVYNLPGDFLGARAVTGTKSSEGYELKQVSLAELYSYSTSGDPVVFSVYGSQLEFRAAPAVDAAFTLIYFKRPAVLVDDSDTNILLQRHPTLYQHASMYWFHLHTQDLELAGVHRDAFAFYVEDVNAQAEEIRGTGVVKPHANFCTGASM